VFFLSQFVIAEMMELTAPDLATKPIAPVTPGLRSFELRLTA
jgi:hypothetical protein